MARRSVLTFLSSLAVLLGGLTADVRSGDTGKIPITTSSEEAKKEFLQARDLSDRLLAQESFKHFQKALVLDPGFASAELYFAVASVTAKDFQDRMKAAMNLADKVTEGERLLILGTYANANGNAAQASEYFTKLVAAFPNDERARLNLGNYFYGQQKFDQALAEYQKAIEIAPEFSPAYNILGYTYRQLGRYEEADRAFKKYIEMIPTDPNPYDSEAELLLKMGKFEESIASYKKALALDPAFFPSHIGIAMNTILLGKSDEAKTSLEQLFDKARNNGERRQLHFTLAVLYADAGQMDRAARELDNEYAIADKMHDGVSMSNDLFAKGIITAYAGKYDDAKGILDQSLKALEDAEVSPETKENGRPFYHYGYLLVAVGKKDFSTGRSEVEQARKDAETGRNPALTRQAHQLAGILALAEERYTDAVAELEQADHQNPNNLYRLALAYKGMGNKAKAMEYCGRAAHFNSLPGLDFAFVRLKAEKMLKEMQS